MTNDVTTCPVELRGAMFCRKRASEKSKDPAVYTPLLALRLNLTVGQPAPDPITAYIEDVVVRATFERAKGTDCDIKTRVGVRTKNFPISEPPVLEFDLNFPPSSNTVTHTIDISHAKVRFPYQVGQQNFDAEVEFYIGELSLGKAVLSVEAIVSDGPSTPHEDNTRST